jgi:uncharacterized protein YndB with AHSA1/START domain
MFLPHPPDLVWRALTEAEALEKWLMPSTISQTKVGHEFTFQADPVPPFFDGLVHCCLLEVDPPHRISYAWGGMGTMDTTVSWTLTPRDGGTELHLEHTGFDLSRPEIKMAYDAMSGGWGSEGMVAGLRGVLDDLA